MTLCYFNEGIRSKARHGVREASRVAPRAAVVRLPLS